MGKGCSIRHEGEISCWKELMHTCIIEYYLVMKKEHINDLDNIEEEQKSYTTWEGKI